jgi:DNA-binding MarR family transcriptional regulator
MKPPRELNITIPASIVALPGLNLIERAILNRIHERPDCSNGGLAMLTGMSLRGIEAALARLRTLGLIRSRGHGRARRLILTFPVEHHVECGENVNAEHHTECGKNQNENTHTECGVDWNSESHTTSGVRTEMSIPEISDDSAKLLQSEKGHSDALFNCLLVGAFNQARLQLDCLRQCYGKLCQVAPEMKERNDRVIQTYDSFIFILEAGRECIERRDERVRLMPLLFRASPERLTEVRQQVEAAKARGAPVDLKGLLEG